ncbi:MAG: RluA family pseudouridine synthase [Spirochaetes bacterium]|nr:RluA family pseudouridine synthase [Spirochaetota bacterium]
MRQNCKEYKAGKDDHNRRLDKILKIMLPDASLSAIFKLMRTGRIRVNNAKSIPAYRICEGDIISIPEIELVDTRNVESNFGSDAAIYFQTLIIAETADLVLVNKPRGMLTHGTNGLDVLAKSYFSNRMGTALAFTPAPLHRLDRNTSGIVAVSASLRGANEFSSALHDGKIHKEYLALVDGELKKEELLEDYLVRDAEIKKSALSTDHKGQLARTIIRPLLTTHNYTLASIVLETGRTHQIRTQCAAHGYALSGDKKYAGSFLDGGYLLHAWKLEFANDCTLFGQLPATLTAPLSSSALQTLGSFFAENQLLSLFFA